MVVVDVDCKDPSNATYFPPEVATLTLALSLTLTLTLTLTPTQTLYPVQGLRM